MFAGTNETTPLLKNKSSDSSSNYEMIPSPANERAFRMFIDFYKDYIIDHENILSNDEIKALTALSLANKRMWAMLNVANPNSPLYYLPPDYLLNQINTLLKMKWDENAIPDKTREYLETLIAELKEHKEKSFSNRLFHRYPLTPPPRELALWDRDKLFENGAAIIFGGSFFMLMVLVVTNNLPLSETMNDFVFSLSDRNESSMESVSKFAANFLAWMILFCLYGAGLGVINFLATTKARELFESSWLKNAEQDLAALTHYPEMKIQEYRRESDSLNSQVRQMKNLTTHRDCERLSDIKSSTLSLFNKVSGLKKIQHADLEAQDEPRLRLSQ